jgi:hypothetical protein
MEELLAQAADTLARSGLTAQDFLDALPEVREAVRRELYDESYLQEVARRVAAFRQRVTAQAPGLGHLFQYGSLGALPRGTHWA